jgi:hypothetical protein
MSILRERQRSRSPVAPTAEIANQDLPAPHAEAEGDALVGLLSQRRARAKAACTGAT